MTLTPSFFRFVSTHLADDPHALRLKYHGIGDGAIDYPLAITQIECRKRFGNKIADTLSRYADFVFPDVLAGEQCTSDRLAAFHATLIGDGDTVVDMTSGLGIDVMHLASKARQVTAIERKAELCEALVWNCKGLNISNVKVEHGDSVKMLEDGKLSGDTVFIDPARRSSDGGRVYALSDCEPDVSALLDVMRRHFKTAVIKASPMLDITHSIGLLPGVTDVYSVGTTTECRELVFKVDLTATSTGEVAIHAVTVKSKDVETLTFTDAMERAAKVDSGDVDGARFVYEPWPSVMKAAPVLLLSQEFGVKKIHNNTHLYFSCGENPVANFPGDVLAVEEIIPWQSKYLKRLKNSYPRISVGVRNFVMSADALRAKLGVKDGGPSRLLGVTAQHDRPVLLVVKPV